jgi:hypothetical protein
VTGVREEVRKRANAKAKQIKGYRDDSLDGGRSDDHNRHSH